MGAVVGPVGGALLRGSGRVSAGLQGDAPPLMSVCLPLCLLGEKGLEG